MKTVLLAIGLLALAFAGIAIKILVKKDGKFSGTCASNNPMLQEEGGTCGVCGARPEEQCKKT
ncbi:MAG: membrane or secreted protein [Flavobacteriales bacterium]|nr:membrane or secreted protein [Flavobacteriales bacterium]